MRTILTMLLLLILTIPGLADARDVWNGPPEGTWHRGDPGTTYEHWDFETPDNPSVPEDFDNPFGVPTATFEGAFEYGDWECPPEMNEPGFVTGWHCIEEAGGSVVLQIPNQPEPNFMKAIFLQITSSKAPSDVRVTGQGPDGPYTTATWATGLPQIQWPGPAPFGGVWYTYNYGFVIRPNPESETIVIDVPYCTVIDQIVVDTICTNDNAVPAENSSWSDIKALYR